MDELLGTENRVAVGKINVTNDACSKAHTIKLNVPGSIIETQLVF